MSLPFLRLAPLLPACVLLAGLLAQPFATAAPTALPGDSIYQLDLSLTDQQGQSFRLAERRGQAQLIALFYTACQFVCPRLLDTLRDLRQALPPQAQARFAALLVTLDPDRDDQAALQLAARQRNLERAQWTLARSDAAGTRRLAAVLGIQYRELPNGDFNHASALILLDSEGRIAARSARLGTPDPAFVAEVARVLTAAGH